MIEAGLTRSEWVVWLDAMITLALENPDNERLLREMHELE